MDEEKEEVSENEELQENDVSREIIDLIRSDRPNKEIAELLGDYHENDIAAVLSELTPEERKKLYRIVGVEEMAEIFSYLDEDVEEYFAELDSEKAADVIEQMDADDAADILDELPEEKQQEILELVEPEAKEDIELINSYDEDEFGSMMTTNFIQIKKNASVKEAMKELIAQSADNDNISTIYTVNDDESFYGAMDLKDLIRARDGAELEPLIVTSYPTVYDNDKISEKIEELKEYSEDSIPVLDHEKDTILGVITATDIVEIVDSELGEDYAKLAGLTAEEDLKEPLGMSIKKRIPWLILLLILGLGVSSVVGIFEKVVQQLTLIICFQSLILDMSGNVGTQSLAVTIRVLTDENLTFKQKIQLILKEMRVGLSNGAILGTCAFIVITIYVSLIKGQGIYFGFATAGCVALALCLSMVISSFTGTVIPLIFKSLKVDPAVASGPLITTVNDLVAVIVYYGTAWILLINVMHF